SVTVGLSALLLNCSRSERASRPSEMKSDMAPVLPTLETLDRFIYHGTEPSMANSFIVDSAGNYFYSMYVGHPMYTQWVMRMSSDQGKTWVTSDDFHYGTGKWNYPTGIAADPEGNVYVSGAVEDDAAVYSHVQKSADHGKTWKAAQHYVMEGSVSCKAYNVKSFGGGLVFSLGRCGLGVLHWLIRESAD